MEFFIDTANLDDIKKAAEMGLVDGVTTNPTLIKKAGKDQYSIDFIENYVFKIIYPPALNYEIQTYLGVILIFVNLVIYYYIVKKSRTGG